METNLTERYLDATVRSLPAAAQQDVRRELSASINEAIDTRTEAGEDPRSAERSVLDELGDPSVLAAHFADRPLHLIGPQYFLTWWRLLKMLLTIIPVCVLGAVALGQVLANASIAEVIAHSVGISLTVALHLCFWVTLVFAVMERTGARTGTTWSVDQLPEPRETGAAVSDLVASLVFVVLGVGALIWDGTRGLAYVGGESMPFLNPQLWPTAVAVLFVLIALEGVLAVLVHLRGRWTMALAALNVALAVVFVTWTLTLMVRGTLVNPELVAFLSEVGGIGQETWRILGILLGFLVVGVSLWDAVDGFLKARRAAG